VPDPVQLARTAAIVDEGLAHCSDNTQLLHLRAMVQLSQGDAPAAEAAMHQLVSPLRTLSRAFSSYVPRFVTGRANTLGRRRVACWGKRPLRRRVRLGIRHQVKADPRNGRAWHSLGLMMQRAGDFEAAEQYFREGVRQARAGPHRAKCYDKLAMEMSVRGSVDEARQLFADGCAAAPGSAYHLRQWALFEKKNGTAEDARRLFEQAAAAQPSASRTWLQVRPALCAGLARCIGLRCGRRRGSLGCRVRCIKMDLRETEPFLRSLRLIESFYSWADGGGYVVLYCAAVGALRAVSAQRGGCAAVLPFGAFGQPQRRLRVAVTRRAGGARRRYGRRARRLFTRHRTLQKGTTRHRGVTHSCTFSTCRHAARDSPRFRAQ
jgi:tetratricopeptide (TPR) repeat protein